MFSNAKKKYKFIKTTVSLSNNKKQVKIDSLNNFVVKMLITDKFAKKPDVKKRFEQKFILKKI